MDNKANQIPHIRYNNDNSNNISACKIEWDIVVRTRPRVPVYTSNRDIPVEVYVLC